MDSYPDTLAGAATDSDMPLQEQVSPAPDQAVQSANAVPFENSTFPITAPASFQTPSSKIMTPSPGAFTTPTVTSTGQTTTYSGTDLAKCISIFTNLFPTEHRSTGEEDEPFVHRLRPILDQLIASNKPNKHHVGTVFSVLIGEARQVAA